MKTLSISGNVRPAFRKFTFNLLCVCLSLIRCSWGEGWVEHSTLVDSVVFIEPKRKPTLEKKRNKSFISIK